MSPEPLVLNHHGTVTGRTTMSNHRRGPGYRQWVAQVMATCEPVCIRCHMPVDMTLPATASGEQAPTTNQH
jgi:hypothetical protein